MFGFFEKKKKEPKDFREFSARLGDLQAEVENLSRELRELRRKNRFSIQKVGIVRFNPFSEVGGNQSFSAALLDGEGSGIVITSLYSREGSRVYGKPVEKGKSEYSLSREEKKAIKLAAAGRSAEIGF